VQLVLRRHKFETPEDVQRLMTQELSRVIERRGEKFEASILAGTRHWGAFLAPLGVKLHGAFTARSGKWAPHSFTFKLRQDLLPRECVGEEAIQPGGSESDLTRPTHIHIGQADHAVALTNRLLRCILFNILALFVPPLHPGQFTRTLVCVSSTFGGGSSLPSRLRLFTVSLTALCGLSLCRPYLILSVALSDLLRLSSNASCGRQSDAMVCRLVYRMGVPDISRGDPSDVFCLVKTYIHDTKLMQDPVFVLPAAFKARVNGVYPVELFPRTQLVKKRRDNYESLATLLVRPESSYPKVEEMVNAHQHTSFASHMFYFVCWPPVPSHQHVCWLLESVITTFP
jgi:hypothetical protein